MSDDWRGLPLGNFIPAAAGGLSPVVGPLAPEIAWRRIDGLSDAPPVWSRRAASPRPVSTSGFNHEPSRFARMTRIPSRSHRACRSLSKLELLRCKTCADRDDSPAIAAVEMARSIEPSLVATPLPRWSSRDGRPPTRSRCRRERKSANARPSARSRQAASSGCGYCHSRTNRRPTAVCCRKWIFDCSTNSHSVILLRAGFDRRARADRFYAAGWISWSC